MLARRSVRSWQMSRGRGFRGCRQTPANTLLPSVICVCREGIPYLSNGVLNDLLVGHIALIANEKLVHTLCRVAVDLLKPLLHIVEAVHVGDIVDDADTVGATVVG